MLVDDGIAAAVASCSVHAHSATATRQRKVIPTPGQQRCTARLPNTQSPREKGPEKKQKRKETRQGGREESGGRDGGREGEREEGREGELNQRIQKKQFGEEQKNNVRSRQETPLKTVSHNTHTQTTHLHITTHAHNARAKTPTQREMGG